MQQYYDFPLNTSQLIKNKTLSKCDIKQSIANHLHLIMTSRFGECHSDKNYGCALWKVDFNNMASDSKLITIIEESLYNSLRKYEVRLSNINISIQIEQKENTSVITSSSNIQKFVLITIAAVIKKTNEQIEFKERFYIAPLSY